MRSAASSSFHSGDMIRATLWPILRRESSGRFRALPLVPKRDLLFRLWYRLDCWPTPARTRMSDVTRILSAIHDGDRQAADRLLPLVYDELRKLASQRLAHENPGQTLQATALVHEAYLRLVGGQTDQHWDSRGHFFAAAAEAMRRILIENARRKKRIRHGGDRKKVEMLDEDLAIHDSPDILLALDQALTELASEDSTAAELVKLRVFAGLSIEQAAELLGFSRATAFRHWSYARAWLSCELNGTEKPA
jgi:RNA polymerase sigma factor (TIGR02999 family)